MSPLQSLLDDDIRCGSGDRDRIQYYESTEKAIAAGRRTQVYATSSKGDVVAKGPRGPETGSDPGGRAIHQI
jgi:hypothetical protein